jgi:hypothetical protein
MRLRTTLGLLVAVLVAGALIIFVERDTESTRARHTRLGRLFSDGLHDIDTVLFSAPAWRAECRRTDDDWDIVRPIEGRADAGVIERVLAAMESMTRTETITTRQRRLRELQLGDFGLGSSNWTVTISGPDSRYDLRLGDRTPVGDGLYLRFVESDDILLSQSDLLDVLPGAFEDLRDRALVPGETTRTTKLVIEREGGGFMQLSQNAGTWTIQQPLRHEADNGAVNGMLDVLYGARVNRFVWDKPVSWGPGVVLGTAPAADAAGQGEAYGLAADAAHTRITVWGAEDDTGTELLLGKVADEAGSQIYARLRDGESVMTTDASLLDAFDVSVNALRSRVLFPVRARTINYMSFETETAKVILYRDPEAGWMLREPVQWKADTETVEDVMDLLLGLRIERFLPADPTATGEEAPDFDFQLCLASSAPLPAQGETGTDESIRAAAPTFARCISLSDPAGSTNPVVAHYRDDDARFELAAPVGTAARLRWTEPLVFRDRTVLALEPGKVTRVVLKKGDVTQALIRSEGGTWLSEGPDQAPVHDEVISDLLFRAAHLRALRIETDNLKDLAAYGLEPAAREITFGLSGEEAIQRSLLLGFRAGTDGIYAMVQGEDVVFALSNELAAELSRDLLSPAAPAE